ncbi:MAG: gliding motility-associated C-terminal domain-containing protein, partial [Bacteroidota bacterium]
LPGPEPPMLGDTVLCPGEIWTITVPELEGGTFTWTPTFTDSTLRIDTVGDYSLTLTDSCGRDTTVSFFVDYLPPSTPPNLGPDTTVCANGLTELDAGPGWESYLWFDLSTDQMATAWGPGDFWVQVTDSCGQVYSDTMTVSVEAATELDLGPPDDTIACGIDSISLSAPAGYQRYEWFPVGPFDCNNCPDVRVAAPAPGSSLTIFALAYTENGCAAGDSLRIWTSAGQGQNISDVFCNGTTYTYGDSTFTESGQYFVPAGCGNDTLNLTELPPVPTMSETFNLCRGDSLFVNGQWYVAPNTAIDTFSSVNGCDSVFVTNLDVFFTFETSEDFSLCANDSLLIGGQWYQAPASVADTLGDLNGCDSFHTINLLLLDDAVITEGTARICAGDSIFIQGEWQTEAGVYSDSLVGATGCDSIHQITLAVDPIPEATWLVGPECDSEFLIVTIVPTAGQAPFDISWDQGPGQPPLIGPEQMVVPGTYRINIVDANGCVGVQDIPVPFFPPIEYELESAFFDCPPPDITDAGFLLISDISQLLDVSINGVVQSPTDSIGLPPADRYVVSITDIQGCVLDTIIQPETGSGSGISVTLPSVIRLDLGDSVRLDPQISGGSGPLSFTWIPETDLSCSSCPMPWASPAQSTDYTILVSDSLGCTGQASTRIELIANSGIYMPTAFSPNEDGVNDRLFPGVPPAVVQIQSFQIYDRWGGMLYQVDDVAADDGPSWGWNGESNGRPATVGVYVWTMEVVLANGRTRSLAGDVTLIR